MAERAQNRFLTAITPPPKPKGTYVHQDWPAYRFHPEMGGKVVQNQEEADALIVSDERWSEVPYPEPEPVVKLGVDALNSQNGANLQLINKLIQENQDLVAENMNLKHQVQEAGPAAAKLKELQAEMKIIRSRMEDAEHRIELARRAKLQVKNLDSAARRAAGKAEGQSLADVLAGEPEPEPAEVG